MVTSSPNNVEGASGVDDVPCGKASDGAVNSNRITNLRQTHMAVMRNRVRGFIVKHEPAAAARGQEVTLARRWPGVQKSKLSSRPEEF